MKDHSIALMSKSTWFTERRSKINRPKVLDLPKKALRYFGFHELDAEVRHQGLIAMIKFCYTEYYGHLEVGGFSQQTYESHFLLNQSVHAGARHHGIPSLVKHTLERAKDIAKGMRKTHSETYISVAQDIVGHAGWDPKDTMKKLAIEQWQLTGKDGEVERTESEWICGCDATIQYLLHAGRNLKFALEECPNCLEVYGEEGDGDMDDTQVKVEDAE
jgi:hypothetical protein